MNTRTKKLRYAGAYITDSRHRELSKLAKNSNRTLAQYTRHIIDAVLEGKIQIPDSLAARKEGAAV